MFIILSTWRSSVSGEGHLPRVSTISIESGIRIINEDTHFELKHSCSIDDHQDFMAAQANNRGTRMTDIFMRIASPAEYTTIRLASKLEAIDSSDVRADLPALSPLNGELALLARIGGARSRDEGPQWLCGGPHSSLL